MFSSPQFLSLLIINEILPCLLSKYQFRHSCAICSAYPWHSVSVSRPSGLQWDTRLVSETHNDHYNTTNSFILVLHGISINLETPQELTHLLHCRYFTLIWVYDFSMTLSFYQIFIVLSEPINQQQIGESMKISKILWKVKATNWYASINQRQKHFRLLETHSQSQQYNSTPRVVLIHKASHYISER